MTRKEYFPNLVFGLIDLGLILLIIFLPLKTTIDDVETLASLKKTQFSLQEQADNFVKLNKDYRSHLSEIKTMDTIFVDEAAPVDFLSFFEGVSQAENLSIKINPSLPQRSKNDVWGSMIFQVSAQGRLKNFLRFLEKLENGPYLMEIFTFNLKKTKTPAETARPGENPINEVEATFSLRTYTKEK